MENPWSNLPEAAPFLLAEDRTAVEAFNRRASANVAVHPELLPEPFLGNPHAPIVLLNLNPGFDPEDEAAHGNATFVADSRRNLSHGGGNFPFFLLDPRHASTPGGRWWRRRINPLIRAGLGLERIAQRIFCIEFFPYHSRKFGRRDAVLHSQQYGFTLLEEAMKRDALIVVMRSEELWAKHVPDLLSYRRRYRLNSSQNVAIAPGNCPGGFPEVVSIIAA